ncbi:MAG TPA: DUF58 domain-containing protein [Rhodoglobus sp.]|nr:DUF58 domain-containing protein [Rhodoglobus sp.]
MTAATDAPLRPRGSARAPGFSVREKLGSARRGLERTGAWLARAGAAIASIARPLAALVWLRVAPYLGIVAPAGWITAALAASSLIAGFILGWQELIYLGLTLAAALIVCVAFLFGRSTYSVTVELNPSRVVVGDRALGRLAITNSGAKSLLPSRMELPVGTGLAEFSVPSLKSAEEHEELFTVPTNRRAVIVAGPAVSVRGDQLGLLRRTVRWTDPTDLFVHPVTIPLAPSAAGLVKDLEGQVTKTITNNDISFHALRPYQPGDDRRYVHWRTSARTGQLMVRQFEETRRSQLTVIHSEYTGYYASESEFELAVSVMASMAAQVIRDGTQMSVVSETRHLRTHSPSALLDDSCRLELVGKRHSGAREFARDVTRRLPPPSVLVVIAGSLMTTNDYRAIEALFPSDTTMLAFRVAEGSAPALKPVTGMLVATIGELSDLPKVLRRAAG